MEKEKEEKKKKRKAELERKRGEKKVRQEKGSPSLDNVGHCAICRSIAPPGSDADFDQWIQCELCQLWFHYVCVGLDVVPDGEWLCHKCGVNVM